MVLIDSSVLIQAQRLPESPDAVELAKLLANDEAAITGPVVMELLRGSRSDQELVFLTERLSDINYLDLDRVGWIIAGRLSNRLQRSGLTLTAMDIAVAATAIRYDEPLYTLDGGFQRIPELKLYEPPSN